VKNSQVCHQDFEPLVDLAEQVLNRNLDIVERLWDETAKSGYTYIIRIEYRPSTHNIRRPTPNPRRNLDVPRLHPWAPFNHQHAHPRTSSPSSPHSRREPGQVSRSNNRKTRHFIRSSPIAPRTPGNPLLLPVDDEMLSVVG
jgi:hypothetical protein